MHQALQAVTGLKTRATEVRKRYGLKAAQVTLGHATADVTQVYAERDLELARRSRTIEPRPRLPVEGDQTRRAGRIRLVVRFVEGRRHLPIIELQRAA